VSTLMRISCVASSASCGMVEHADGDIVNPRLMPVDQIFERLAISRAGGAAAQALILVVGGVVG